MKHAALALMLACTPALADSVQLHTVSHHVDNAGANETNTGIGYTASGYSVGYFRNSQDRGSVYAGRRFRLNSHVSATLGAATGYNTSTGLLPLASLSVRPFDTRVSPVLTYQPTQNGGVFLLSLDLRIP